MRFLVFAILILQGLGLQAAFAKVDKAPTNEPRLIIESGIETKAYVKQNLDKVFDLLAADIESDEIYIADDMICLSSYSYIPEVGHCQMILESDGLEASYVILVKEANPKKRDGKLKVELVRLSTNRF